MAAPHTPLVTPGPSTHCVLFSDQSVLARGSWDFGPPGFHMKNEGCWEYLGFGVRAGGSSGAGVFQNDLRGPLGDSWKDKAPVTPWRGGREDRKLPTGVGT